MGTGKNPLYKTPLCVSNFDIEYCYFVGLVFSEVMILLIQVKLNTTFNSFACLSCCQSWTNNCKVQGFPGVTLDPSVTVEAHTGMPRTAHIAALWPWALQAERSQRLKILVLSDFAFSSTACLRGTRYW